MVNSSFKQDYLRYCSENVPDRNKMGIGGLFLKLVNGEKPDIEEFEPALQFIYYRFDCCDFQVSMIVRMLYMYRRTDLLTEEVKEELKQVLLDFDYWFGLNTRFPGIKNF